MKISYMYFTISINKLFLDQHDRANFRDANTMITGSGVIQFNMRYQIAEYTIMQYMADQEHSDLHVVFTMILCGTNFCMWQDMKLIFAISFKQLLRACIQVISKPYDLKSPTYQHFISNPNASRLLVKATQK